MKTNNYNDIKILFTDLDDTLLTHDKRVSDTDLASIREIIASGHKFVVATGRPFLSAKKLCDSLGFSIPGAYIIASNGGVIYDCTTDEFIVRNTVGFNHVRKIFEKARSMNIHIQTYTDSHVVCENETNEIINYSNTIKMPYRILEQIPRDLPCEPPKVIAISNDRNALEALRESISPEISDSLITVFSSKTLLEFLPKESTKGNAVKLLAKRCNVHISNTIACGDQENDISMIQAAGIGVAVNNAVPEAKKNADYITISTNNDHAISEVINKFIL